MCNVMFFKPNNVIFSHCPSLQAQPGQVPRPVQHGGRPDQDEQSRGGHQGLPEAARPRQAEPGQGFRGERLWLAWSQSPTAEKIRQVTGLSHPGM